MIDRQMDGLILVSPLAPAAALARFADRVPVVVVGRHGPGEGYDTVSGDDLAGSALVVNHLVELGHDRIAFLGHVDAESADPSLPREVRKRGYRDAMRAHRLDEFIDVIESEWSESGGKATARSLLRRVEPPPALFGGADVAACGVLGEFWRTGRQIPEDMSLVGYDNTPIAEMPPISLTTIDQAAGELGTTAARLILERIEGRRQPEHVLTAPSLVIRRTSGPPR